MIAAVTFEKRLIRQNPITFGTGIALWQQGEFRSL